MKTRNGFTLVEMLVVIVIIAALMSVLVPAIYRAVTTAKVSAARVELSQLEVAITTFKAKYGNEPPSFIILCENPADWNSYPKHQATIRSIWPQYDFSLSKYPDGTLLDINRNGVPNEVLKLDGAECLVFFIGGFVGTGGAEGHNKNPSQPFKAGGNREGPFFEFDVSRFQDLDGDGFKEYRDKLSSSGDPIVYYSSYEGAGYNLAECCYGMKDVYRITPAGTNPMGFWKAQSFQLIAPGYDGILGEGGNYDPNNAEWSLAQGRTNGGKPEYDNLTNFSSGKLVP